MNHQDDIEESVLEPAFSGLERRRRSARSAGRRRSLPVSFEEWFKNLALCCQRLSRSRHDFAVANLFILEYAHVKDRLGPDALTRMTERAERVMKNSLRKEDLAVSAGNGDYLILLPETSVEEAQEVLERLARDLAESERTAVHENIRMSCVFKIVSPSCQTRPAGAGEVENSPREILRGIGCDIDSHGRLKAKRETAVSDWSSSAQNFDEWLKRYGELKKRRSAKTKSQAVIESTGRQLSAFDSVDRWRDGAPVTVKVLDMQNASKAKTDIQALIHALRLLQDAHHPGIAPALDFCLENGKSLYIVEERLRGARVSDFTGSEKRRAELLATVIEILLQLALMASSVVPVDIAALRLREKTDEPVFDDYELLFLPGQDALKEANGGANARACLDSIMEIMDGLKLKESKHYDRYEKIRSSMIKKEAEDKLSQTLREARSELRRIVEDVKRGD